MRNLASFAAPLRSRTIAYWGCTLVLATENIVGGVLAIVRYTPYVKMMEHLGYPVYLTTIIGIWYGLAGVALLAPRFPRIKEWAYAGLVINYTGAAASHMAAGDGVGALVAPTIFTVLATASWALRPPVRRLDGPQL
jgi:uncharacterized membrane protein YphA (DoxX/SURF4 family)